MRYIEGTSRSQMILFPETVDEYISDDNTVRFIEAYVNSLSMKELGFTHSEPKETGRKPYDPSDMLRLYIYGYIMKIRSSRGLENETYRNIELMWLMKRLHPDFKTIADFRKDNIESIRKVCREFTVFCKRLNLFGSELVAIDGSKFKAVNSKGKCYTRSYIRNELEEIDKAIEKYLKEIEQTDSKEKDLSKIRIEVLQDAIENMEKEKKEIEEMLKEIEAGDKSQVSKTDSDSRMMKTASGNYQVSYNAQIGVDSKHHMIIESEVTNDLNDIGCLSKMAQKSKESLGAEKLKVVSDSGYYSEKEINECQNANIEVYVAIPQRSSNENEGRYSLSQFTYEPDSDRYICPQNKEMTYRSTYTKGERSLRKYECSSCSWCEQKKMCTTSKGNRYIIRSEFEDTVEALRKRLKENKDILRKRSKLVEHVFGTMKAWLGYGGGFLLKGLKKVNGEFSLIAMVYNMKRAMRILGVQKLIESLAAP